MNYVSLETAERMLIKFDGTKSKLFEFIDNCDDAMRVVNPDYKNHLFTIIRTKITDKARAMIRCREFPDWESLRMQLLEAFSEKRTLEQWQLELNSCKQNYKENVISFANRVESCYINVINSIDHTLDNKSRNACVDMIKGIALKVFINGLNKDLTVLVKSQRPSTLENAISLALDEEQQLLSNLEVNRFHNNNHRSHNPSHINYTSKALFCRYCKKSNHTIDKCFKLQNKQQNKNNFSSNRNNNNKNNFNQNHNFNQQKHFNHNNSQSGSSPLNQQGPPQPAVLRKS